MSKNGFMLLLRSAKGPTVFPELVVDGGFDDATKWAASGGWSVSGSKAVGTSASFALSQAVPMAVGVTYNVTFDYTMPSGQALRFYQSSTNTTLYVTPPLNSAGGSQAFQIVADGTGISVEASGALFTGTLDNLSIKRAF